MAFERMTQNVMNVSGLPNVISGQATTLKNTFDKSGSDLKTFINNFLTTLESPIAATNIGADVETVATKTLQAILTAFDEAISDRYTKTEAETLISSGTNDLVANVDVNLTTGVITVTKKDCTTETFDTALEKVPAKFEIVETDGNYALKITNVDGTSTQTDITNLMNIYNFNSSDTVGFEVIGEGAEKTVVATIRDSSIGLEKLSLTAVTTLEGYMNSAKDSANAAKTSETNAKTSETNAANSASTAVSKAAEATAGATTATTKADEASKSAEDAEYWAKQAQEIGGGDFVTNTEFDTRLNNLPIKLITPSADNIINFNDLRTTGIYVVKTADNNYVENTPYNYNGAREIVLMVNVYGDDIYQTWLDGKIIYKREVDTYYNTWGEWYRTRWAYNYTIPSDGWSNTAPYYVDINISGLFEVFDYDTPHITPVYTGTVETDKAIQESWNKIDRIVSNDGSLRVYAFSEIPTTAIPVQIEVVR